MNSSTETLLTPNQIEALEWARDFMRKYERNENRKLEKQRRQDGSPLLQD